MKIEELIDLYARSPQSAALAKALGNVSMRSVFVEGLTASAAAVLFASVTRRTPQTILFILPDADEAGYFYQDLRQMLEEAYPQPLPKEEGNSVIKEERVERRVEREISQDVKSSEVLFFPSSYRRQVKYGQRDAANEILRTEVLARLNDYSSSSQKPIAGTAAANSSLITLHFISSLILMPWRNWWFLNENSMSAPCSCVQEK